MCSYVASDHILSYIVDIANQIFPAIYIYIYIYILAVDALNKRI